MYSEDALLEAFRIVLIELRKDSSLSQMKLADRSGLHRNFISFLETGKKTPSLLTFFKLSHGLSISPDSFINQIINKAAELSNKNE